jgi:hypothetical protein
MNNAAAGGGPASALYASKFAGSDSDFGKFNCGASRTLSRTDVSRATRIACFRLRIEAPPLLPAFPFDAPPRSLVRGSWLGE